jgi:predicted DsbA family dithiol-disulfide isomerase
VKGILFSELYKGRDLSAFRGQLRERGREFGIVFGDRPLLSNSRMVLEASEFARDAGMYEKFHELVFHAYFTEGLNIGDFDVIAGLAEKSGLQRAARDDLRKAIDTGRYKARLESGRKEGEEIGLTGVPTFILNGQFMIVGAQDPDVFRNAFKRLGVNPLS